MPTLVLGPLVCKDQNDSFSDEPYITVNGTEVWQGGDVDAGESRLNYLGPGLADYRERIQIGDTFDIALWERDGGNINDNDLLGSYSDVGRSSTPERLDFHGSGADYDLYYFIA